MSLRAPLAVLAALLLAAPAAADTTLDRTIRPAGSGAFQALTTAPGERHVLRRGGGVQPVPGRARRRASLLNFAQLTDPQIADEMSPARVDFVDPAGGEVRSAHRPQEAMGLQVLDQAVRSVNANLRSPVRQGDGRRARLRLAIATGDMADNQQLNETRWFRDVLDGGRIDPFSGRPIGPGNPCAQATPAEMAAINADVAARRYTGVQDYDDYATAPAARQAFFWDPDQAASAPSPYAAFPRVPNLMDRAQMRFKAAGLDVPWYVLRGNHDGLIQGNAPASIDLFRAIAVGCLKVFPNATFDPADFEGASDEELFAVLGDPSRITQLLAGARPVAPDPARRIISKQEYRSVLGGRHGFGHTPAGQLSASRGTASYYAWSPRPGLRFVSLDTVAEGGGDSGNLDHPQYLWLRGELRRATRRGQLVVAFGHHTLGTMNNARSDELAGACQPADEPGCDRDPRRSTPLHRGTEGARTVRALFARTPNVIAYVAGHTHANRVTFQGGFWEINTASHIDWPQQSRLIEIMDNRDGTLSLFGTLVDHAGGGLASLARTLSWNDPQRAGVEGSEGDAEKRGARRDRNVELLLRDPRYVPTGCQAVLSSTKGSIRVSESPICR
jgi:metallophosphoesterase (TIGR03767 family)